MMYCSICEASCVLDVAHAVYTYTMTALLCDSIIVVSSHRTEGQQSLPLVEYRC